MHLRTVARCIFAIAQLVIQHPHFIVEFHQAVDAFQFALGVDVGHFVAGAAILLGVEETDAVPGVKDVVQISYSVAVVADSTWAAIEGRKALDIQWDEGAGATVTSASIRRMFEQRAQPGVSARKDGDAASAFAGAARKIEALYEAPFLAHAPMEPMNCTAVVRPDGCEVWASTQMQTPSRDIAAQVTGLPPEKVKVHTLLMGGGFGRRARVDYVAETVEIAKAVGGAPVKLTWTREDDMRHDYYRPASYVKFAAALDGNGWPASFSADVACPPFPAVVNGMARTAVQGIDDLHYSIPNIRVDYHVAETHVPVSYWRSVGHSQNTFFVEGFIDELAAASGKDPVEFRRHLLAGNPRLLGVLNIAAEKAGWGKPLPAGRFRGIAAVSPNIGSFNAQVAEISVKPGKLRVERVVCVVDCGYNVNPAITRQQTEGGIVYGLAAALKGSITIDRGRVEQANFDTYDVIRIDEMPRIEVHIVPSTEAPGGIGEASVPGIAPAIANAVFAATGKRLRKLPIRNADLA